jgi:hypothetical protein
LWDFFATKLYTIIQSYMHITQIQTLFTQTVIVNYSESVGQGFQLTGLRAIEKISSFKSETSSTPSNNLTVKSSDLMLPCLYLVPHLLSKLVTYYSLNS